MKQHSNNLAIALGVFLALYALASAYSSVFNFDFMHQVPFITWLLNPFQSLGLIIALLWGSLWVSMGLFLVFEGTKH